MKNYVNKKPISITFVDKYRLFLEILVEAAGIEPASKSCDQ